MNRRSFLKSSAGLSAGLFSGCAGVTSGLTRAALAPQPPVPGRMLTGINACFEAPVDPDTASHIKSWGKVLVRATVNDCRELDPIVEAFHDFPSVQFLLLLPVFDGPTCQDVVRATMNLPWIGSRVWGVEWFNETVYQDISARDFGVAVGDLARWAKAEGFPGEQISGGIPNMQPQNVQYLREAKAAGVWPSWLTIGVHRYDLGDPTVPHKGYRSRDAEWTTLKDVCAGNPWALTEHGYVYDGSICEDVVANYTSVNFADAQAHGAVAACLYQITDGVDKVGEFDGNNHYGVRTADGRYRLTETTLRNWGTR